MTLEEARELVQGFNLDLPHPSPKGCCLTASSDLSEALYDAGHHHVGIQWGMLADEPHCWVEVFFGTEGYLIDLTADQFGPEYPPVIFEPRVEALAKYGYTYMPP